MFLPGRSHALTPWLATLCLGSASLAWGGEESALWSLRPVIAGAVPTVANPEWSSGEIDRFLLAAMESRKVHPAPEADRATLLRRLTFDLTGLPPSPEERELFLADESETVLEDTVDRLLASPRFGERWARHWLDVARYAESNGRARNMLWHHAWRYRDWVIGALNRDLPFDEFARLQIAGDLLERAPGPARDDARVAVGFLALGAKSLEEPKREVFVMDHLDEQIDTFSRAFLGLSVACARCHDHKFDPIPTRDYYALAGIFLSTKALYGHGPMGISGVNDSALQAIGPEAARLAPAALAHLEQLKLKTQERNKARSDRYRVVRRKADAERQLKLPSRDDTALTTEIGRMAAEIADWDLKVKALEAEVTALETHPPPQPAFCCSATEASTPTDCRLHVRGMTGNLGDPVPRACLPCIPGPGIRTIPGGESGRRQLADWLTDPANPLTARVAVNRIWSHLMGRGLVATPDDFGMNGSRPSHPELLDRLAWQFQHEMGWSVKRLIRTIVLTKSYRLSSTAPPPPPGALDPRLVDPDNTLHWRHFPRALEAEVLRDALLQISGELDTNPPKPGTGLVASLPPLVEQEFHAFKPAFLPEDLEHQHRSVYLPLVRGELPEFLKCFDFPDPGLPLGRRDETVVPTQASFLLNAPWVIDRARHTARRLFEEEPSDVNRRLERLSLLALGRPMAIEERAAAKAYLAMPVGLAPGVTEESLEMSAWTSLCQAVLAGTEFRFLP